MTVPPADTGWTRWLPGLRVVRSYQRAWLRHDLVAGLVMTTMLVPVGIAYAEASGVPGIYGLYATIVPLLAYAVFGPSRILVLGPDSALAAVILATVAPLSGGDARRAVALAGAMALVSGAVCVIAGLARLGFVTELLSKPIRYGYMNGIALTVLLSQTPKLLGFSIESTGPLRDMWAIARGIVDGKTNLVSLAVGGATLVAILALKRFPRVPGILLAVVGATLAVALLDLGSRGAIKVLGAMPYGLPMPTLPLIGVDDLVPVVTGGIAVALVSFADTSVLSRTYAARLRAPVDPNQEMVGLGAANLAAGFFQGFPISSQLLAHPGRGGGGVADPADRRGRRPRHRGATAVRPRPATEPAERRAGRGGDRGVDRVVRGGRSAAHLSDPALGVLAVDDLLRGGRHAGAIPGIALAIVIAVIEFLWDGWRPHSAVLGHVDGVEGYHDITRYPDARLIPGLVLFRWDAPLFFANAELFCERVQAATAAAPGPVRCCVVAAEPVTSVDVTAADLVAELDETLHAAGTVLCFAEMKDPVKDKLKRFGLFSRFGAERFFATIGEAVEANRASDAIR
jgi:MFS superfamily sulfate permease-like transporter